MSKKSIDRKTVQKFIIEKREQGKTDQEIYHELSEIYFDKKTIALLITGTVTKANKEKYKSYNNILLALLVLTIAIKVMVVESVALSSGSYATLFLIFLVPLINIYFFFEIARYTAFAYRFCGIFTLLGFMQNIRKAGSYNEFVIYFLLCIAIVGFSFYLDGKLFPHYAPNKLKKGAEGEYIIPQS